MLNFDYDGKVNTITAVTSCAVSYTLKGGNGGYGGSDASHYGSQGLQGDTVYGYINLTAGQSIKCIVGSGGLFGTSNGSSAAGGSGGYAEPGYSGGRGGNAGPAGYSGGGGGGGGATTLKLSSGEIIAIAAGGGGGGGAGNYSNGFIQSLTPYGFASTTQPLYYPRGGTNGAWNYQLKNYSIWNGDGEYTYTFYFPETIVYSFWLGVDDIGSLYVDGVLLVTASFRDVYVTNATITAGWHTIKVTGYNTGGGPAGIGASITRWAAAGAPIWTTLSSYNNLQVANAALGLGGQGQHHRGDGGGGGGGGGGFYGGNGGLQIAGDNGAPSGSTGYSLGGTTTINNGAAVQLHPSGNGADGFAQFSSKQTDLNFRQLEGRKTIYGGYVEDALVWKPTNDIYYRNNNVWQTVSDVYVRNNGAWVRVYGDNIPTVTSVATTMSNASGNMTPYPPDVVIVPVFQTLGGEHGTPGVGAGGGEGRSVVGESTQGKPGESNQANAAAGLPGGTEGASPSAAPDGDGGPSTGPQ